MMVVAQKRTYAKPNWEKYPIKGRNGKKPYYNPEYAAKAAEMSLRGATHREMMEYFKISHTTFYLWVNCHIDFAAALKVGKDINDDRVVGVLYQKAVGYEYDEEQVVKLKDADGNETCEVVAVRKVSHPDTGAMCFWLKNRRRSEWRDNYDENKNHNEIKIVVENASPARIEEPDPKLIEAAE